LYTAASGPRLTRWPLSRASARTSVRISTPFLVIVERRAGIPLGELRTEFGLERRIFDRTKRILESWLCVLGRERDDVDFHTHEPALFPWSEGKIARGTRKRPAPGDALDELAVAVGTSTPARLFPVARAYSGS
jgi:hypothetical protein